MAQSPFDPPDDGTVGMPRISAGMNKLPPRQRGGGRGAKDDDKTARLGVQDVDQAKVLDRARKRMDRCISAESDNREEAREDLKFKAGDQWPSGILAARSADKRPSLTVNKMLTFIHQVTNEQRLNRPAINVSPVGERGDRQVAQMYRGLIRAIERESRADIAYDTGFDSAVSGGFGYWRIVTEYERPETFNQVIRVKRIRNPFTVYMDPTATEPDGSDAKYAFVSEMIPRSEFEERYPGADPMSWMQNGIGERYPNWIEKDSVRVAEYFEIDTERRTLVLLSNGHEGFEDELDDSVHDDIKAGRLEVMREREAEVPSIRWYTLSALEVLDSKPWAGRWIPIVRVIGDEIDIDGKVRFSGVIRFARDAQRMYNFWVTAETEAIALAPKAPWIMEEGQIEGHENEWQAANTRNLAVLTYKGTSIAGRPAPPPQRQPFPGVPAGVVQAKMGAAQDMIATTGIRFDATMNERMTDESGVAVRELRRNTDLGSYHFTDNFGHALRHTGDIMIDLIPKIYDTRRILTILREDDSEEQVMLDPAAPTPAGQMPHEAGKMIRFFNPKYGKYGVTVTLGPSFATKRIEAAEQMMAFARAMPQIASGVADLIAKNQDWPGAEEFAARLAKMLPPGLLTPDMKDVPPQVQAMLAQMQRQLAMLMQERQKLVAALADKNADRQIEMEKINRDFSAKLLAIMQKADAAQPSPIEQMHTIAKAATEFDRLLPHPVHQEG